MTYRSYTPRNRHLDLLDMILLCNKVPDYFISVNQNRRNLNSKKICTNNSEKKEVNQL